MMYDWETRRCQNCVERNVLLPEDVERAIPHTSCANQQAQTWFLPQGIKVNLVGQQPLERVHVERVELVRGQDAGRYCKCRTRLGSWGSLAGPLPETV